MKIEEILGGKGKISLPISNEESNFIDKIKKNDGLDIKTLSDREKKLSEMLIRRDVIYIENDKVKFNKLSGPEF
jgi:hypothetical protein